MSFIIGKVSLGPRSLPSRDRQQIEGLLAEAPGRTLRFDSPNATIWKVDLGVFEDEGFASDRSGATAVAGHPLLPSIPSASGSTEGRGAATLNRATREDLETLATGARGSWAAARYTEASRELLLLSDRCGVRPLYWWTDGNFAVFSSTLRAASGVLGGDLLVDMRAVFEELTLGYALSDRTAFVGIRRIGAGEIVRITPKGADVHRYASWPLEQHPTEDLDALTRSTLAALESAVQIRVGSQSEAVTFLSGGMDSRAINALLHDRGIRIHAFTFSPEDRLDSALARQYAEVIGCHHVVRSDLGWVDLAFAQTLRRAWMEEMSDPEGNLLRALLPAWSGDGGSVCGGWVYLSPTMVSSLREGRPRDAVDEFLQRFGASISPRDIVAEGRSWLDTGVADAILAELEECRTSDPVMAFFHFLVRNDQRRHLDRHHEDILDHKVELWLPFFDTEFLIHAFAAPPDESLGHGFYEKWFQLLPGNASSVAWQTYPGHRPCPLPVSDDLSDQWEGISAAEHRPHSRRAKQLSLRVFAPGFPSDLFSRKRFLLRFVAHHLGFRDSGAAFGQLDTILRYLQPASGATFPWQTGAGKV